MKIMLNSVQSIDEQNQLCPKIVKKKIIFGVIIGHMLLIFLPIALGFVFAWIKNEPKKLDAIEIKLIDPVYNTPLQTESYSDPVLQEVPEIVKPPPPVEPKVTPKVEPKVEPKKVTPPKVEPKKVVPKKVEPKKAEPKKVTPPKVAQPDFSDLEVVSAITTVTRQTTTTIPQTPTASQATSNQQRNSNAKQDANAQYDAVVAGVVNRSWIPPRKAVLSGRKVQALIYIKVDKSGKIIEKKILKKSGFSPMDQSVLELLRKLVRFPVPNDGYYEFEFLLNTEDKY